MRILVTGFDPFGGDKVNPAFEVLKRLKKKIGGAEVSVLEVPTAFDVSVKKAIKAIKDQKPEVVLMIGQAGGRFEVSVERVAINLNDARIPDNLKRQPVDVPIDGEGPAAYFATLPVKDIAKGIREAGVPALVSYTAGTFVCNHLMYGVLNYLAKNAPAVKAGFIHIPFLLEQAIGKPSTPAMALESMVKAIEAAIAVIAAAPVSEAGTKTGGRKRRPAASEGRLH
jgi:pyroglutamyl-peptidase